MSAWHGTTVLVTGAAGFIGSHLTERLVSLGARVRAFDLYNPAGHAGWLDESPVRREVEVLLGDVTDPDSVRQAAHGAEVIFHLAALIAIPYSYQAPLSYLRTNAEGTFQVLSAARAAGTRLVVHTSTSEVYGTARRVPIDEAHPLQAQSPYAASKIAADKLAEAFHLSYGLPVVTVRPFNTFGPRQSTRAVIPTIIAQALGQPEIRLGDLRPTRDLNFVQNTVDGFVRAAGVPAAVGQTVNLGTGREISIGELAGLILRLMGIERPIVQEDARLRPAASEVGRLLADHTKARELLGWTPRVSLEEGLAETIPWMQRNLGRYHADRYHV